MNSAAGERKISANMNDSHCAPSCDSHSNLLLVPIQRTHALTYTHNQIQEVTQKTNGTNSEMQVMHFGQATNGPKWDDQDVKWGKITTQNSFFHSHRELKAEHKSKQALRHRVMNNLSLLLLLSLPVLDFSNREWCVSRARGEIERNQMLSDDKIIRNMKISSAMHSQRWCFHFS